jgi:hypothetical protein
VVTSNTKAGSKLGHHVCTTCGRPFSRSYSARRHLRDQHQGYGQITSLTEYIFGLSQGRYLMPTYTLPKAQRSAASRKWSSNYRGGVPSSFDAYIKTFTDFYSNDLIRLGYNIIGMNQMSNQQANPLLSNYYYYGYPTPQWTTNSTWAMPRARIQAPSPPLRGYYYPSRIPAYSGHQKAQKKPERDTHDNGAAPAVVAAAASGPRDPKPQGSRPMLLPKFGGIFTLDKHEEAVGEDGSGGTAVHWVLAFAFHEDQKISFIKFWRFDRDPTSLLLASDENDDDTTHQDDGAENNQTLEARVILQVKPRKWRHCRFFANERAVRTHRCCSSCKETALDNGIFQVLSVNAGMIAFKLQGQKYYAAKCEFRANSSDSKLYQVTAGVS